MFDLRPVGYVTGLLVAALGLAMLVPMAVDMGYSKGYWAGLPRKRRDHRLRGRARCAGLV
jgi:hypothetical protein